MRDKILKVLDLTDLLIDRAGRVGDMRDADGNLYSELIAAQIKEGTVIVAGYLRIITFRYFADLPTGPQDLEEVGIEFMRSDFTDDGAYFSIEFGGETSRHFIPNKYFKDDEE